MTFQRLASSKWHDEVPGARWFRADLHLHTLDDHFGGRIKRPPGLTGDAADENVQHGYARALLRAAVSRDIQVLGLTPHCVRSGNSDETSATWRIVEMWNSEADDDGIPFRDKIYAVFPGFEPSLSDGSRGVHLLFLFDPEIGRDCYIRAFHSVMGGALPWDGSSLTNSRLDAKGVFAALDHLRGTERLAWDYLCLAPHAFGTKGLFGELKSQILQSFPTGRLSGLELGDTKLPSDELETRAWLGPGMAKDHHAFFHASDAYVINPDARPSELFEIGSRFSLVKLAAPRIEALRQAFLSADSRLRIAYERDTSGGIVVRGDLPNSVDVSRPWLRSLTISGGTSFFAGHDSNTGIDREQTFKFNPDLTCIIGGRMAGKSTLLDGLRIYFEHDLPVDAAVAHEVEARGHERFLSGDPRVVFDLRGDHNPTQGKALRWPARFYTQRELQKAVTEQQGLRKLLYRLVSQHADELVDLDREIETLDGALTGRAPGLSQAAESLEEAQQSLAGANQAKESLGVFAVAGVDALWTIQSEAGRIEAALIEADRFQSEIDGIELAEGIGQLVVEDDSIKTLFDGSTAEPGVPSLAASVVKGLETTRAAALGLSALLRRGLDRAHEIETEVKSNVARALVEAGRDSEDLNRFDALTALAAQYETRLSSRDRADLIHRREIGTFEKHLAERDSKVTRMRILMGQVRREILARFHGRIRVRIIDNGVTEHLGDWLRGLRSPGVTRWWNERPDEPLGPEQILDALDQGRLTELGMSEAVASSFREAITGQRRLQLRALRSPDKYILELSLDESRPDQYREMSKLSGGQQVSLLLSLLLETTDSRPLIIDQPEEELDKAYLFSTVLPALRRLKGQRQIIFVTHDANIVVNGDADQVIFLDASSENGWVSASGAIEAESVREAVIRTLDGGRDAFELRQLKYGF